MTDVITDTKHSSLNKKLVLLFTNQNITNNCELIAITQKYKYEYDNICQKLNELLEQATKCVYIEERKIILKHFFDLERKCELFNLKIRNDIATFL